MLICKTLRDDVVYLKLNTDIFTLEQLSKTLYPAVYNA